MGGTALVLLGGLAVALLLAAIRQGLPGRRSADDGGVPGAADADAHGHAGPTRPAEAGGGVPPPESHRSIDDAVRPLLPDGGLAALGLAPATARPQAGDDVPADLRLADAREAISRFAERLSALERERSDTTDPPRRAALDEAIAVLRRRLQMTELAERAVMAELASSRD